MILPGFSQIFGNMQETHLQFAFYFAIKFEVRCFNDSELHEMTSLK